MQIPGLYPSVSAFLTCLQVLMVRGHTENHWSRFIPLFHREGSSYTKGYLLILAAVN